MLKSLLIKDIRLLSRPLILGIVLIAVAYVAAFGTVWATDYGDVTLTTVGRTAVALSAGSILVLTFGMFACAMVSGNSFAIERMDRSSLFLDYLPPSRSQVLSSKLIVVVGFTSVIFALALMSSWAARSLTSMAIIPDGFLTETTTVWGFCKLVTCVTGVSFAVSSIAKSNSAPILLGLFSPLVVVSAIKLADYVFDLPVMGQNFFPRLANGCLLLGVAGLVTGCHWFVARRYEN